MVAFSNRRWPTLSHGCGAAITPTEAAREDAAGPPKLESKVIPADPRKDTTARTSSRDRTVMKTPRRFSSILSLVAAVAFASVAVAQPPPEGSGGPLSPGPGGPGSHGTVLDLSVPPPPPPPGYHHRHYRSSSAAGDSSVARVESALERRGYYSSAIDGDAGSGTRAAIRGFREANGLGSSTRIDGTLLRALGL